MPDSAHHRMPRLLRHSSSPCSRPCRDPAGAQPSRFSPRGESERGTGKAGPGEERGRGLERGYWKDLQLKMDLS